MSVDWWCEITMKNHKVKLIIFISNRFGREKTKRIIASRFLVISPQSSPEKKTNKTRATTATTRKGKSSFFVFIIIIWPLFFFLCFVLFLSFFSWGQHPTRDRTRVSVIVTNSPRGWRKRGGGGLRRRKTKTTRAHEWNMKRWNQLSWLRSMSWWWHWSENRKIHHYSSLDWFSLYTQNVYRWILAWNNLLPRLYRPYIHTHTKTQLIFVFSFLYSYINYASSFLFFTFFFYDVIRILCVSPLCLTCPDTHRRRKKLPPSPSCMYILNLLHLFITSFLFFEKIKKFSLFFFLLLSSMDRQQKRKWRHRAINLLPLLASSVSS